MKSKFIVIEGLDGAGKSTASEIVVQILREQGIKEIIQTREPGGTPLAEQLRVLIKQKVDGEKITHTAEVLMIYAARAQLLENVIKPALARDAWVVGDRHDLSSQAYQGGGREIDQHLMENLRVAVLKDFKPDLTIYLDLPPMLGLKRVSHCSELDRIEQESLDFFIRTRERYLELVAQDNTMIKLDATQSLTEIYDQLRQTVLARIVGWRQY